MVCYYCGGATSVTNSRFQKRSNRVWRRRRCDDCGNVITTLEALDYTVSITFKTNTGRLEPFLRDKLFVAVFRSLEHRKTAVADATALTETIMSGLNGCMTNGAVERDRLTSLATAVLQRFDPAAGVHYQAFHPVKASS
jgi:transcriptional regulator NrdR family protein